MYQQQCESTSANNEYYNNYSYSTLYNNTHNYQSGYYGFCNEYPQQVSSSLESSNVCLNDSPIWSNKQNYSWSNYYNNNNQSLTSNSTNQSYFSNNQSFNNSLNEYSYNTSNNNNDLSYCQNNLPIQSSPAYVQKPLEIIQPNIIPAQAQPKSKASKPKTITRGHQQLSEKAVDVMNTWFLEHINNPYPVQQEKETLAQLGGITVKQVTAWFSNRRNRSQNTKPKRMKRVLEKEISNIFNELICNQPNREQIIEKFHTSLDLFGNQTKL